MLPIIIGALLLCALGIVGVYVGLRLARAIKDQFDELLPQRMVDYSGFIKGAHAPE